MAPKITLRNDPLAMDTEVLLHFGNGDERSVQKVAKEIVMPHRMYGRSTIGEVRASGFDVVGSSVELDRMPPGLARIQPWHSTVFLRMEGFPGKLTGLAESSAFEIQVQSELTLLFSLFERVPNRWTNPPTT